jgi:hypothetical protein
MQIASLHRTPFNARPAALFFQIECDRPVKLICGNFKNAHPGSLYRKLALDVLHGLRDFPSLLGTQIK